MSELQFQELQASLFRRKKADSALKLVKLGELWRRLEAFGITLTLREALCGKCGQEFTQSNETEATCTLPELGCSVPTVACEPQAARPTCERNKKR